MLFRSRSGTLVIHEGVHEGARPSPRSLRLVRPKTEPGLLPVKPEHAEMATDDEAALKWAREDYIREQVFRQRRAYAELQAQRQAAHRGREEGGVVVLDNDRRTRPGRPTPHASATLVRGAAGTAVAPAGCRAAATTMTTTTAAATKIGRAHV